MKTLVTFRSKMFPPYEDEEEMINPGLWGKRLAEYLVEKLRPHGVIAEEIIAEDWGWYIPIKSEGFRLGICCGHQDGDEDEYLCFTEPAKPVFRKLFRKVDVTQELNQIVNAMETIFSDDPAITDIEWSEPD